MPRFCFDEGDIKELLCPVQSYPSLSVSRETENLYSPLLREISYWSNCKINHINEAIARLIKQPFSHVTSWYIVWLKAGSWLDLTLFRTNQLGPDLSSSSSAMSPLRIFSSFEAPVEPGKQKTASYQWYIWSRYASSFLSAAIFQINQILILRIIIMMILFSHKWWRWWGRDHCWALWRGRRQWVWRHHWRHWGHRGGRHLPGAAAGAARAVPSPLWGQAGGCHSSFNGYDIVPHYRIQRRTSWFTPKSSKCTQQK